jgi:hypothetical protein
VQVQQDAQHKAALKLQGNMQFNHMQALNASLHGPKTSAHNRLLPRLEM